MRAIIIFLSAFLCVAHLKLTNELGVGLQSGMIGEFFQLWNLSSFIAVLRVQDFLLLLFFIGIFSVVPCFDRLMRVVIIIVLIFFYSNANTQNSASQSNMPISVQSPISQQLKLPDRRYVNALPLNVVVIVLESANVRIAFESSAGKTPMPFLQRLSTQGTYLANHYASNNSSPRALFAIFSGLYENSDREFIAMRSGLRIANLWTLLTKHKSKFFVTPQMTDFYFPARWINHCNCVDVFDFETLPLKKFRPGPQMARHELDSLGIFSEKLSHAQKPFVSVYYTYAGHWPYESYPLDTEPYARSQSLDQYRNALRVQDEIIHKIYIELKNSEKLNDTILVIVGDHGEAFEEHKGNRGHTTQSFNENLRVPMLFFNEKIFTARRIETATTHADILPTLVDAMQIDHAPANFQGLSVLRPIFREYIFAYGNEGTVTSVSAANRKLQLLADGGCRVFDLIANAQETTALDCAAFERQRRATERFQLQQPIALTELNLKYISLSSTRQSH